MNTDSLRLPGALRSSEIGLKYGGNSREGWGAVTAVPEPIQLATTRATPGLQPLWATVTALFPPAFPFYKYLIFMDLIFFNRNSEVCYWGTVKLRSWNSKTNRWKPHSTRAPRALEKAGTEITVSPGLNINRGWHPISAINVRRSLLCTRTFTDAHGLAFKRWLRCRLAGWNGG